jgi:hypothetical protein
MATRQRALFAVLCFVWGTTWLAMKVGIAVVPPGVFAGTRWTTAGLMLLLWRFARGQRLQIPMRLTGSVLPEQLRQVPHREGIDQVGGRRAAGRIHPHVKRPVLSERESPLGPVELRGADAQVE